MTAPYDRATTEPGGMQCEKCGVIFVGAEWHDLCAVCSARPDAEMLRALEADGEKLRQLTGDDHGPWVIEEPYNGYAPCPHCFESSGYMGQIVSATWTDPSYEDTDYTRRCEECGGTGMVECDPMTLDDLEDMAAQEEIEGRA